MDFQKNGNWNREFNTPKGMAGQYLRIQGNEVERIAKILAPIGTTGRLRDSIERGRVSGHPRGLEVEVTAGVSYAMAVHEGTKPHTITPDNPGGVLVFPSKGGIVFTDEVDHPGTKGQPFLRNALVAVTRKWQNPVGEP